MRDRVRSLVPFLALGFVGAAFDAVRRLDPVPVREQGGFYAGDVTVHLLGFPVGVHQASLWPGTALGLRPVYLLELGALYLLLHAAAAVAAGRAYASAIPDAEPPTRRVYSRLFVASLAGSLALAALAVAGSVYFLLVVALLVVLVVVVLPNLVVLPPILVAEHVPLREGYRRADALATRRRLGLVLKLAAVGVVAGALVSVPAAGGFLGTAGGAALYAELGRRAYTLD